MVLQSTRASRDDDGATADVADVNAMGVCSSRTSLSALDANRAHAVDIAITITHALERGSGGE